jgi:hypothetical protein
MFLAVSRASGPFFMFCAPRLVFDGTEGVGSLFHVLRSQTHFRWYRGRRVPFYCFVRPDSFSAVPRTLGLVFMFCTPGLVFGRTEGVPFRCKVFRYRTCFRRYRGRRVPFSCLACPDTFSLVPRPSGPVFMFYAPRLIFSGTEGVPSRFHVFRSKTCFRRYRARRVPFLYFPLPDIFWVVPRASGPVFMFCAPGHVFGGTEGVGSRFHVLRSRTRFRRYGGRRVPFSCFALLTRFREYRGRQVQFLCFALPDSFSVVPWVSIPIFMFSARTLFRRFRGRQISFLCFPRPGPVFMSSVPGLIFGGTESVDSLFRALRSRTRFWRYRGRRVSFSCFALPDSFSAVPRASGPVFMFCAP